jgi:hypothetical protein
MEYVYIAVAFAVGVVAGWAAGIFNLAHLHNKYDALAELVEHDIVLALGKVAVRVSDLEKRLAAPGK